jgi:hypothetical protein
MLLKCQNHQGKASKNRLRLTNWVQLTILAFLLSGCQEVGMLATGLGAKVSSCTIITVGHVVGHCTAIVGE